MHLNDIDRTPSLETRQRANDPMYAARSAASVRVSDMFGIFGWGSSRKSAIAAASKPGFAAMVANGGAASVEAPCCTAAITWHASHHRFASRPPLLASAAIPDCGQSVAARSTVEVKLRVESMEISCMPAASSITLGDGHAGNFDLEQI